MSITELTPFQMSIIASHMLNDCEVRFWLVPDKNLDQPLAYIEIENYFLANQVLLAAGIIDDVTHMPEVQIALRLNFNRKAYATQISEIGFHMFNTESTFSRAIN